MLTSDVPSNTADAIPPDVSPALLGRVGGQREKSRPQIFGKFKKKKKRERDNLGNFSARSPLSAAVRKQEEDDGRSAHQA